MTHPCYMVATLMALVSIASAQQKPAGDFGRAPLAKTPERRTPIPASDRATAGPLYQTLANEFIIHPGVTAYFEWLADLSGCEHVAISITTLTDIRSKLTDLRIGVAFASPGEWYVVTDVILGNSFFYDDHGGATVRVYGPLMKLAVTNDGLLPVKITRLTAYAVPH